MTTSTMKMKGNFLKVLVCLPVIVPTGLLLSAGVYREMHRPDIPEHNMVDMKNKVVCIVYTKHVYIYIYIYIYISLSHTHISTSTQHNTNQVHIFYYYICNNKLKMTRYSTGSNHWSNVRCWTVYGGIS